jgi:thiamine biosynthesis protein ThiI
MIKLVDIMWKTVIVRYGELALKSWPVRRHFERRLVSSINLALRGLEHVVKRERGRIFVDTKSPAQVAKCLSRVPGIVSVSLATKAKADMSEICKAALRVAKKVLAPSTSFAVRTSRVGKHTFSSRDVNVEVGSAILSKFKDVHVDLSNPDREIFIEVREKDAYVFTEAVEGVGGLPAGTQGSVVALFSGSRNDVAVAYLMIKRGSTVFPVFPNPCPYGKVPRFVTASAEKLADFDPKLDLRVFPFHKVVSELKKVVVGDYAYYICKRSALKAADAIAGQVGAEAIVVADDIKQITAQKLANLSMIDEACKLPVLRPLAGFGGAEIERLKVKAKLPSRAKEACPFPPPRGIVDLERIHELEEGMKIGALIEESLSEVKVIKLG